MNKSIIGVTLRYLFFCLFLLIDFVVQAQAEQKGFLDDFRGTVSVTHNGIALVPSFSLGEPTLLFDLKFTKGDFSFEPDMRFALEGQPWAFLFWVRYKAVKKERLSLSVGVHPSLNFRTTTILRNERDEQLLEARRFLASELAPNYTVTKNISVGAYYLYVRGFDDSAKNIHFLVVSSSFNNINIGEKLSISISPRAFYLKQDRLDGFYAVTFLNLGLRNLPLSITGVFNKAVDTEIEPDDDFIWSILLNYHF